MSDLIMDQQWRWEQSRYAIKMPHRKLARLEQTSEQTVSSWANGVWPIPSWRLFRIAKIQSDLFYIQRLAVRCGYLVIPRPLPAERKDPIILLANFASATTQVLELVIEKLQKGEELTPIEAEEAERLLNSSQSNIETLREIVKERTRKS